ncbi:tRNA (guanosine(37)-N1)-methyltransferase TrmD [bacterium]|nr:tRNA (guanosine(37)-N1)-methyltransferase TrmD [bacterium]
MTFHIISVFPEMFESYFSQSIIKRALDKNLVKINLYNLRDYTKDKHKNIDDTPYGGGAGMILKIEPLYNVLKKIAPRKKNGRKIILLSAKGSFWTQKKAKEYSEKYSEIILICGRYEGVDERVLEFIDEEISIGEYILTGGEIGAMTIVDSISRLIPKVLGNNASLTEESYNSNDLEYPQYTKPNVFKAGNKKYPVPEILLSGNHKKIKEWRNKKRKKYKK